MTYADLSTVEGLNVAAHKYYDWTDAQTAAPNDGKALYGRDALTNYLLCGAQELGTTIFDAENGVMTLHFDKPTSASCGITTMSLHQGLVQCQRQVPQRRYQNRQPAGLCRFLLQRFLLPHPGADQRHREPRHPDGRAALPQLCRL